MLRSRVIPCLLIHNGGLVKTVRFKEPKYIGDPINAVRIFNEKEVDELVVLDIDASVLGRPPNFRLIEDLAAECRMPLCYGGGVADAKQATRIVGLGVEKVAISSAACEKPNLISDVAAAVGSQSVVAVLDVKKTLLGRYSVWTHNATRNRKLDPIAFAIELERLGAGEIVVNSVDRDGAMLGYDIDLAEQLRNAIALPMTVLGGAGSLTDMRELVNKFQLIGVAAGSLFVFKGKYRAVLINYPGGSDKSSIIFPASE